MDFDSAKPPAVYFSIIWQSFKIQPLNTNFHGLGLGVSIPVYSHFKYSQAEFQFSGNIQEIESWGRVQGVHKESISLFQLSKTLFEAFFWNGFRLWLRGFYFLQKSASTFLGFWVFSGDRL